jgi:uncharacterized protein (DUF2235 family)
MKRIALCFDGTWQSVDDPASVSNVVRVAQAIKAVATKDDVEQITYYQAGVGSDGGLDSFLGGLFGVGLRNNVKRALAFLSLNYTEEDEIYIFGFSRGAYTARAVAGVIGAIGGIPMQEHFDKLEDFWNYYRIDPKVRNADTDTARRKKWDIRKLCLPDVPREYQGPGNYPEDLTKAAADLDKDATRIIKCVGVWDTVGSYGVPSGYGLDGLARRFTSWTKGFHDQEFGKHVQIGLHALAIDERRRGFPPTAWRIAQDPLADDQVVEQVWFAGSHSNIGGSYRCSGLSDLALIWMMSRVEDLAGLEFDQDVIKQNSWPCATCSLYNSAPPWMVVSRLFPHRREVLSDRQKYLNEMVHWSVLDRRDRIGVCDETRYRPYRPRNLPKDILKARKTEITKKEREFIDACSSNIENDRRKGCVMAHQLDDKKRNRRARRLAKLQASWPAASLIRLSGRSEKGEGSI